MLLSDEGLLLTRECYVSHSTKLQWPAKIHHGFTRIFNKSSGVRRLSSVTIPTENWFWSSQPVAEYGRVVEDANDCNKMH